MKKIILYFTVFVVTFFGVSLIANKNYDNQEESVGDVNEYTFSFNEVTIENEKIVAFDNTGLDYLKYYVVEFTGEQYVVYNYHFFKSHDEYVNKYDELVSSIVDYNYEVYMIKTLEHIAYGTYDEVLSNLQNVIEDGMLYIIY